MIGTFGYCVYVCGFLMSVIFLEYAFTLSWIIACSAAAVGGLAGGLLWTAQVLALQSEIVLCFPSDCLIREGVSANTRRSIPQLPDCQSIKSPPISLHCLRHIFSASVSWWICWINVSFYETLLFQEMAAKLLATMIYLSMPEEAPYLVFSAYTLLAVGSCLYTSTLEHFDDLGIFSSFQKDHMIDLIYYVFFHL